MNEPVFQDGGDPVKECKRWWKGIRRTMLRRCVDRIGFGGYLDLACKYPKFLDYVERLSDEFRTILQRTKKTLPYSVGKKVVFLNTWGKARSWMHDENWPFGNVAECLSGLPVDVDFMSFDDIRRKGIGNDVGLIINWGSANSAWSGGEHWIDSLIVEKIREWIYNGGSFIGIGEPTAHEYQGSFFQLEDVLGVQKEVGNTRCWHKNIRPEIVTNHFILEDSKDGIKLAKNDSSVYLTSQTSELIAGTAENVVMSTNVFGKGRSVYMNGYSDNAENGRLLYRAILWASGLEGEIKKWFSSNPYTDCAYYPAEEEFVVANTSDNIQETILYNSESQPGSITLAPMEIKWFTLEEINKLCR